MSLKNALCLFQRNSPLERTELLEPKSGPTNAIQIFSEAYSLSLLLVQLNPKKS